MAKELDTRQLKFIDAYIRTGNAGSAAREAGYSEKYAAQNADKLLKNTNIWAEYQRRLSEMQSSAIATEEEILVFHTGVMRGEIKEEVINPVTGKHEEIPAGLNIRQKSADALLKHMSNVPKQDRTKYQALVNAKLEEEIRAIKEAAEAKARQESLADEAQSSVQIYLPEKETEEAEE